MKEEQINIAIAHACGWKYLGSARDNVRTIIIENNWESPSGEICMLPNYCNDLNAMQEAWFLLSSEDKFVFERELQRIMLNSGDLIRHWLISATASQRAEAFLRTIGKWEEAK